MTARALTREGREHSGVGERSRRRQNVYGHARARACNRENPQAEASGERQLLDWASRKRTPRSLPGLPRASRHPGRCVYPPPIRAQAVHLQLRGLRCWKHRRSSRPLIPRTTSPIR
jgi:hypothetical protein